MTCSAKALLLFSTWTSFQCLIATHAQLLNDLTFNKSSREGDTCSFIPWDLERIRESELDIDGQAPTSNGITGSGVHIYVIDTGISPHVEFGSRLGQALDCTQGGQCRLDDSPSDSLGHGTAVASVAAGSCLGVASGAIIHPIRVVDSNGNGSLQSIVNGIRWATETANANGWPGIINLSMTVPNAGAVNEAISMAVDRGLVVISAAGNQGSDACDYSPGSSPLSVTVGATKIGYDDATNSLVDEVSLLSNTGECVSLFAPGEDIPSASNKPNKSNVYDQIVTLSGTSQAAPLVSGAAALYLEQNPTAGPHQVKEALISSAIPFPSSSINAIQSTQAEELQCCSILNINRLLE